MLIWRVVSTAAFTDCGACVGGTTGRSPERDCANQCSENRLVSVNGSEMCVMTEAARQPPCDGLTGSGAYHNL